MFLLAILMMGAGPKGENAMKPMAVLEEPNSRLVVFSPDGKTLATRGGLWDVASRRCMHPGPRGEYVGKMLLFSPDGRTIAVSGNFPPGGQGGYNWLRDVATGQKLAGMNTDNTRSTGAFAPDGKTLAFVTEDQTIEVNNAVTLTRCASTKGDGISYQFLTYAPDGRYLTVVCSVGEIPPERDPGLRRLEFAGLACSGGDIRVLVAATLRTVAAKNDGKSYRAPTYSPDRRSLAVACSDGTIQLLDPVTLRTLTSVPVPKGVDIWGLAYSPDGRTLAAMDLEWRLWFCDLPEGRPRQVWGLRAVLNQELPPAGTTGAVGGATHFAPAGGPALRGPDTEFRRVWAWATIFTPDGRAVAIPGTGWRNGTQYGAVYILDMPTGRQIATLEADSAEVGSLSFGPNGELLATGSGTDRNVKLWDTGKLIRPAPGSEAGTGPRN